MPGLTLTDAEKTAQPLLEEFGIIVMPETLGYATYKELVWALVKGRALFGRKRLALWCGGEGGYTDLELALSDLITEDGRIDGILIGAASSAHSGVWAACSRRYVYPNARIKVHGVGRDENGRTLREPDYRLVAQHSEQENWMVARIYARASNKSAKWWRKTMLHSGTDLIVFTARQLVQDLDMAQPISKRKRQS